VSADHEPDSMLRYLSVLRERIWLIVLCTVLVFAAAVVYVVLAPKTYTATAQLQVSAAPSSDSVLSTLPVLHASGDPTQDVLSGAELVTSPQVAAAVVKSLGLTVSTNTALGWISATPIGQSSFVAVEADTDSAALSQRVADAFVNETIAQTTASMHAAIASQLPGMEAQLAAIPAAQRYGPGTQGDTVQELQALETQPNPTLILGSTATLPTAPSSPKKKLTLIAGLIAGLVLGVGVAFAAHALDPRLRRASQLRDLLGVPVLARILKERRGRVLPLLPTELSISSQEGYRTLRTMLSVRRGAESPVYLVTGSGPGEGKSTTAISLAWSLAHTGASVILIEADVRRPTFAAAFELSYFSGIDQVLTDEVSLVSALAPVLLDDTGIRVLAARHSGFDLSDGLTHDVALRLLDDAKTLADYVVIDSPPLTVVSDALPFAQLADEIVVVARLDVSRLNRLIELDDLLRNNGVRATGIVVVGDSHSAGDAYYSGYSNGKRPPLPARRSSPKPRSGWPIDQT
jgi:polysaccharide biosynthesis transport protein